MDLATAVRHLRGLRSQEEFAELVGVGRVSISLWETGKAEPALSSARRLVELGLDPNLLLPQPKPTPATTQANKGAA